MKTFILLALLLPHISQANSKKPSSLEKQSFLESSSCPKSFNSFKLNKKKNSFKKLISLYKVFPCFPQESLEILESNFSEESWLFAQLSKSRILKKLSPEERLKLDQRLLSYTKKKPDIEKKLISIIAIKKKLKLDFSIEEKRLQERFISYDPKQLKKPSLKVAKDFKRRGLNSKALLILESLYKKNPGDYRIHRELIRTQKNIKRNERFLFFSQRYVDLVKRNYFNKPNSKSRNLYLKESLRNVRRIWTYRSTPEAKAKLLNIIKTQCKFDSECPEHFWIMGRIYEEHNDTLNAEKWLLKAAQNTKRSSREYITRVWNLVWLQSKEASGPSKAFAAAESFISKLSPEKVSSKLYFWMSKWTTDPTKKDTYIKLIKKHHPLSFYLWSPLALGLKTPAASDGLKKIYKKAHTKTEKNLLTLIRLNESSLARGYISFIEKKYKAKKSQTWKRLKALSGMYTELLTQLEAGQISLEENLQYFFSRSYPGHVSKSSQDEKISSELIWSIIRQESNFDTYARSWADAFGLMQILPKRAVNFKNSRLTPPAGQVTFINPFLLYDPGFNIEVGAWLLRTNLNKFEGKLPLAIAAYNASINKVHEWEKRFYKGNWLNMIEEITYRETRKYVKLVLRNMEIYKALNKSK